MMTFTDSFTETVNTSTAVRGDGLRRLPFETDRDRECRKKGAQAGKA